MRLPPRARALFDLRRAGRIPVPGPFGHVSIVPDWHFEVAGAYVIAPPDIDPIELDFCFCAGLTVCIFCRIGTLERTLDTWLEDVIVAVMRADAKSIAVVELNLARAGLDQGVVAIYMRKGGDD